MRDETLAVQDGVDQRLAIERVQQRLAHGTSP